MKAYKVTYNYARSGSFRSGVGVCFVENPEIIPKVLETWEEQGNGWEYWTNSYDKEKTDVPKGTGVAHLFNNEIKYIYE